MKGRRPRHAPEAGKRQPSQHAVQIRRAIRGRVSEKTMHVFYINLERRADRNAEFLRRNSGAADCQRVRACEGGLLRTEDLIADGSIIGPLEAYTPGGLGNALSHKGLWERAMAAAGPLTIAEDDAVLNQRFSEKAARLSAKLIGNTKQAGLAAQGYTEKWLGQGSDGEWYSAFRNPTTGRWTGGDVSSHE